MWVYLGLVGLSSKTPFKNLLILGNCPIGTPCSLHKIADNADLAELIAL